MHNTIHYCSDLTVGGFKKNFIFRRENEKLGNYFLECSCRTMHVQPYFFVSNLGWDLGSPQKISDPPYQRLGCNLEKHDYLDAMVDIVQVLLSRNKSSKLSDIGIRKFWCLTGEEGDGGSGPLAKKTFEKKSKTIVIVAHIGISKEDFWIAWEIERATHQKQQ